MQRRSLLRWWPLLVVALASACTDETTPTNTGGSGGSGGSSGAAGSGGATGGTGGTAGTGGSTPKDAGPDTGAAGSAGHDGGQPDVILPGDGGLSPCALDLPTVLDRPPSGALPCDLLPPGFVAP
jgi:hypothetical protein